MRAKWTGVACVVLSVLCLCSSLVQAAESPKYVFLFIGDGMGIPQRMATDLFLETAGKEKLLINRLPAYGVTTTRSANSLITDSSSAATAIATGVKTNDGYVGVDTEFKPLETIAEMLKKKGMKVGIVTSVSMDHATPASFYAHQASRNSYYEISLDMTKSGFDYFGGGAFQDPDGKKSKNPVGNAYDAAKENGYTVVTGKEAFAALTKEAGKVFAYNERLDRSKALPYSIDTKSEDITLAEFTQKGIELLDNPNGFFMMVEGGKIDWTCHANDAATAVYDVVAFDNAVKKAYAFYEAHPDDTLIVVTGDHETGGLTIGFAGTQYASFFELLKGQKISFDEFTEAVFKEYKQANVGKSVNFDDMIPLLKEHFGLEVSGEGDLVLKDYELAELKEAFVQSMSGVKVNAGTIDYLLYGSYDPFVVKITHILNQKAGLGWTTYSHTGVPVGTSAVGISSEVFNGFYDNTDIAKKLMTILGVSQQVAAAN